MTDAEDITPEWLLDWTYANLNPGVHARYLFNFRYDPAGVICSCADAASWPNERYASRVLNDRHRVDIYDEHGEYLRSEFQSIPA